MNPLAEHAQLITQLAAAHRPYGWTDNSVDGYLMALGDLPVEAVRQAVIMTVRTRDKMPSPAELRRDILAIAVPDGPPHVDLAWLEVESQLSTVGRFRTPTWSHPLIGVAVEQSSSWWRMCISTDLTGDKIGFKRTYQTLMERAQRDALLSIGLADIGALTAEPEDESHVLEPGYERYERSDDEI